LGWYANNSFTPNYYQMYIPDPSTPNHKLIVTPYVLYAIQAHKAEVSATYGKGYPILTCALTPTAVDYLCIPTTPTQLALLVEHPYAQAITKVIEANFPTHLIATLKQYQHFQEKKYNAQQRVTQYKA